jgi:putative ABC transport system permease protein
MTALFQDVRYGFRMLAKSPGFTAVAVLTLAVGIGANTVIFSAVNGLFLRGLAVENPGALVALGFSHKNDVGLGLISYPDFDDIQRQAGTWVELCGYRYGVDGLSEGDRAEHVVVSYVTGDYFTALRVRPAVGRLILPSEGKIPGTDAVMVLGYSYWQARFGGDPSIVGKAVRVNGHPVTVVGVAQQGFRGVFPTLVNVQAYLPLNMAHTEAFGVTLTNRATRALFVLGRLRPGVSVQQAGASMNVIATRLSQQYPGTDLGAALWMLPQRETLLNPFAKPGIYHQQVMAAGLFLALALLVLLLACFNVANILLVRATTREHEMAARAALGAPRGRLLRQLLAESFLLAVLGCFAGLELGAWGVRLLQSLRFGAGMPFRLDFSLDWRVYAYAAGTAVLAGLVVGIMPGLRAARVSPSDALHEGGRTVVAGRHRLRNLLVTAQVAGSMVLLIVAGLFTRSLVSAQRMDLGFNPSYLLNLTLDPHEVGYDAAQRQQFYKDLLVHVQALPGVRSASVAHSYPSSVAADYSPVYVEGYTPPPGQAAPTILTNQVTPDYFATLEIPLLRGRAFRDSDTATAPHVAVINQTMAQKLWPNQEALGKRFRINSESDPLTEIVGIARDSKYIDLLANGVPYFYVPLAQHEISFANLQVRTVGAPESIIGSVEEQVHRLAPTLPIWSAETMEQTLKSGATGFYVFHLGADLAGGIGILGLVLAVLGVYGVVSYSTSQRTHEIGVRMALGAHADDIWRLVLPQGLAIVACGSLVGIGAALAWTRVMERFLVGVTGHDPLTYTAVTAVIAAVTLLACYVPARRATKVDPMVALRYE